MKWAFGLVTFSLACGAGEEESQALAAASQRVVFESLDKLGPHRSLASLRRMEERPDREATRTEDAVEIAWKDWNNFEHRRVADGRLASLTRVVDGTTYLQRSPTQWERRDNPEPARVELRDSWNLWELGLAPFDERLVLEEDRQELIEGRPTRVYRLTLAPPPEAPKAKGKKARKTSEDPIFSLEGWVWVDSASAARLLAEVKGAWRQGDRTRRVELDLAVSAIGQEPELNPPPTENLSPPGGNAPRTP